MEEVPQPAPHLLNSLNSKVSHRAQHEEALDELAVAVELRAVIGKQRQEQKSGGIAGVQEKTLQGKFAKN